jgi:hypothetical protein
LRLSDQNYGDCADVIIVNVRHFYFIASRSTFSIIGSLDKSTDAFAINAFAISPFKCASLASSVSNVSNIPKSMDLIVKHTILLYRILLAPAVKHFLKMIVPLLLCRVSLQPLLIVRIFPCFLVLKMCYISTKKNLICLLAVSHIAEQKRVRDRSGRFNQKTFFEPVADRLVVPFQRCISNGDCNNKKDHPNTQAVTHRYFIFGYPARVKVNERVMGDIKRVRYIAEKLAGFGCKFPCNIAPGTDGNYQWENNNNAECFI